ncbi:hypothetical protein SLS64_013325 [Diaporthe eres]
MSLRTRDTPVLRAATVAAFLAGIPISTSAGNKNILTDQAPCKYTGSTVCVASSNETYQKSWFSNYGPNVFIIAPGSNITAASHEADNYVTTKSGTSMASPLVAGVMANFVSFEGLWDDVPEVWKRLRSNQLSNIIGGFPTGAGDQTTNAFLNNGINSPSKRSIDPYAGIPRDELKLAAEVEAAIAADSSNVISAAAAPFPTFFNISREHLTDTGGPTATITTEVDTEVEVYEQPTETAAPIDGDYGYEGDLLSPDGETSWCADNLECGADNLEWDAVIHERDAAHRVKYAVADELSEWV